eukprot:RCo045349
MCAPFGEVAEVAVLPVNSSGVCGAIVRYRTREAADAAIAGMHGCSLPESTKPLQVRYADPRKPGQSPLSTAAAAAAAVLSAATAASAGGTPPEVKLFVGNLPLTTTKEILTALFAPYGALVEAFVFPRGSPTGKCGFVRFTSAAAAQGAMAALNGISLDGTSNLVVRLADSEKRKTFASAAAPQPSPSPPLQLGAMASSTQTLTVPPSPHPVGSPPPATPVALGANPATYFAADDAALPVMADSRPPPHLSCGGCAELSSCEAAVEPGTLSAPPVPQLSVKNSSSQSVMV